jgi:hypothetical protein
MRHLVSTLLVLLVLLPGAARAQQPVPPLINTGAAQSVGTTTATVTGRVDPNGTPTSWRFEYGTTTAYGSVTALQTATGEIEIDVQAALAGLTPSTTYHYRIAAGDLRGVDRTFTTTAPAGPAIPRVSRLAAADKTSTSVRLTARINPNRAATTYYVEWGISTSFGNRTAEQTLPAGRRDVPVSVPLAGLPPYRRIYWRVVAENDVGIKRSGTSAFTTLRALTGATLDVFPSLTDWSGPVSFSGRVLGAGVNGIPIALEQAEFPFLSGFQEIARTRTNRIGGFRFPDRPVLLWTQYRVVTRNALVVASPPAMVHVRTRAAIRATRRTRRSLRLTGDVNPGLPTGRAFLQKRTRAGVWLTVGETPLVTLDATRSTYGFRIVRVRRAVPYRVEVQALDGGAHDLGRTPTVVVSERQKKPTKKNKKKKRGRRP